jgi:hypothetical protein
MRWGSHFQTYKLKESIRYFNTPVKITLLFYANINLNLFWLSTALDVAQERLRVTQDRLRDP